MSAIFGKEFIEEFKLKRPAGYVDLMIAFEARKRTASPFKNNPLNISLPFSFIDFYKKKKVRVVGECRMKETLRKIDPCRVRQSNLPFVVLMIQISNGQLKE